MQAKHTKHVKDFDLNRSKSFAIQYDVHPRRRRWYT